MSQARDNALSYLLLGDVTLVIEHEAGFIVLKDDRVAGTALAEREAANALPGGSPEKNEALPVMKHAELAARNVVGGYWVAAADPTAVENALTGTFPLLDVHRIALLSDGAARAVEVLGLYDWPEVFQLLQEKGAEELIRQIRHAESTDPAGNRWPRNKQHDDATAVLVACRLRPARQARSSLERIA